LADGLMILTSGNRVRLPDAFLKKRQLARPVWSYWRFPAEAAFKNGVSKFIPKGLNEGSQAIYCLGWVQKKRPSRKGRCESRCP
jgi:hypothetical protein